MQITLEELFYDDEFKDIIKEKWIVQLQKLGKLQSNTKNGIITELLKQYQSVEYVKGNRSNKAHFQIGSKRSQEISQADMIEKVTTKLTLIT
ncbi:hypothetical protein RU86_GL001035 [Lactococcus piscium]|uniref:Uncharacterized protein n=1 Tax=Pseudolactococcus piscium TaxID=1364 RepID=A0A2A5S5D6_9LACT|nr:hypothetical protein [Lactococcus piscium]PCS08651.1 hypothetical protein RU86_GL001035 [Lactococcus piscium]